MAVSSLTIAIGIASAGRRDVLADTIGFLDHQTRRADALIICPAKPEDLDEGRLEAYNAPVHVVYGPLGLPAQRNTILANTDADLIIFFDDDFLPAPDFIEETERLFLTHPDVVIATGEVAADGINGPGLSHIEGTDIIRNLPPKPADQIAVTYGGYGCNTVVRLAPVRAHNLRFDENLPLYAWLEDIDFSRQLAPYGRIVRSSRLRGVHLGTKRSGRSPGDRLGYSQIANPAYLVRKGTMSWPYGYRHIAKNITANLVKSLKPEPWVDRKGRLCGNLKGLNDWIRGRLKPSNILDM
ncbi:MAG: glycosyltransferase [Asticcacaulis sp.]